MGRRLPITLGRRIRRARLATKRTQVDVARAVGISQPTVSRLELGNGGAVSLEVWMRVAREVGIDLRAHVEVPFETREFEAQIRCHRSLVELAATGGWLGWTLATTDDPARTTTILERRDRGEVAVVHAWDVVTDVDRSLAALRRQVADERRRRADGTPVSGLVIVVQTGPNHRRFIESADAVLAGLEIHGDAWWTALRNVHVPMPVGLGTIWIEPDFSRLRPRIPYVHSRLRHLPPGA
jgi:transcriptional regulator with XRE-family HTH domain